MKGFLITCTNQLEKKAVKDAYNMLSSIVENYFTDLIEQNANATLENELADLRHKKRFFYNFETNCKGVIFIKIENTYKKTLDPVTIANKLFEDALKSQSVAASNIARLVPVQNCFVANQFVLEQIIATKLKTIFTSDRSPCSVNT